MVRIPSSTFGRAMRVALLLASSGLALSVAAGGPVFSADVACNAHTFSSQGPTTASGAPGYGATFIVHGVIYPEGTFETYGTDSGLLPDGSPEFPDLVIGTWTCRGWFIGDGMETAEGPFVMTTQTYDFDPDHPGSKTLVSEGIELIDMNTPFARALTGGSGEFFKAKGEVIAEAVNVNATGLFNFTFDFDVRPKVVP